MQLVEHFVVLPIFISLSIAHEGDTTSGATGKPPKSQEGFESQDDVKYQDEELGIRNRFEGKENQACNSWRRNFNKQNNILHHNDYRVLKEALGRDDSNGFKRRLSVIEKELSLDRCSSSCLRPMSDCIGLDFIGLVRSLPRRLSLYLLYKRSG